MLTTGPGLLPNAYRVVHIAADGFENRILRGRIYHDSREEGTAFTGLSEMILILEKLFDEIHYPMKSVDHRNFTGKKRWDFKAETKEAGNSSLSPQHRGKQADFMLHVKYRYHATWQGVIVQSGTEKSASFLSLMELMDFFAETLGSGVRLLGSGPGKKMCEITVRSCEGCQMGGDVSHPALPKRRTFINEFDLKEEISWMLDPMPEGEMQKRIILPRSFQVAVGNGSRATFVVRVLFRENATWQGTVTWKEKRRQVNFRSFMELLLLMYEAVGHMGEWQEKDGGEEPDACTA